MSDQPPRQEPADRYQGSIDEAAGILGHEAANLGYSLTKFGSRWVKFIGLNLRQMKCSLAEGSTHIEKELTNLRVRVLQARYDVDQRIKELDERIAALESDLSGTPSSFAESPTAPELTAQERIAVRMAFTRLRLVDPSTEPNDPEEFLSGIGGKSRVFRFFLPNDYGGGIGVIAKFDEPARASREWETIRTLRMLELPREAILPFERNEEVDGLVVYRAAHNPRSTNVVPLRTFFVEKVLHLPNHCATCLDLALEPLHHLYSLEPSGHKQRLNNELLVWKRFFPKVPDVETLSGLVFKSLGTSALEDDDAVWLCQDRTVPNPLSRLPRLLDSATGNVHLSWIHGDLNLYNLLVCSESDQTPSTVSVIDLAACTSNQMTAMDLARLEVEITLDVFLPLAHAQDNWESDFLVMRDVVDGRVQQEPNRPPTLKDSMISVLSRVRQKAVAILTPPSEPNYFMMEYFHCLYFTYLDCMRFRGVRDNPKQVWLAFAGAALALEILDDWKRGRYNSGSNSPRSLPYDPG